MVIILKDQADKHKVEALKQRFVGLGLSISEVVGQHTTIWGLVGDTSKLNVDDVRSNEIVESVTRVQEPYKNANRKFHPDDSVLDVHGRKIGGGHFALIAGPCSVESEEQICRVAQDAKEAAPIFFGAARSNRERPLMRFRALERTGLNC